MGRIAGLAGVLLTLFTATLEAEVPVTLRGSPESMARQHQVARKSDVRFLRTPQEVNRAVEAGELVAVEGNGDYVVNRVSFPFARPETRRFLEFFGAQYHSACGERLVVTSLTRPSSRQPANAHRLSVHPTGLAVDLRVSQKAECRQFLEDELLSLERQRVLDVTRERTPPHYHVAVFPEAFLAYVDEQVDPDGFIGLAGEGLEEGWTASLEPPGAQWLLPAPDPAAEEPSAGTRTVGQWVGRLLSLPARLLGRVLGG
jgi:hypothetical protein